MYGLEKEQTKKFDFDLEKDLKKNPRRAKEITENADQHVHELKKQLREGQNEKEFEELGVMLHAYAALKKVIGKVK